MVALPLASSHIINNGITPDVLHSVLLGNLMACFADDNSNLALIIDSLGEARVRIDFLTSTNDGGETLGEDDRVSGLVNLIGAVETGAVEFFGMIGVVLAYTQHVSATDWWQYLDIRGRDLLARGDDAALSDLNDLVEILKQCTRSECERLDSLALSIVVADGFSLGAIDLISNVVRERAVPVLVGRAIGAVLAIGIRSGRHRECLVAK